MLNTENFDELVIKSGKTALIVFTATWCRPCSLQRETIEKIRESLKEKDILIEIIDVDEHEKLADRFSAKTLPTTVLFAKGQIIEILAGYQTEEFLVSYLQHIEKIAQAESENC